MESCRPLMEYSYFVQKVKRYSENLERDAAIELAVDECIKENILKDILIKNRAEVVDMLLTEYDEEKRIRIMTKQIEIERQRTEEAKQRAERERQEKEEAKQRAEQERQEKEEAKQRAEQERQEKEEAKQRAERERQEKEEYKKRLEEEQQEKQELLRKLEMLSKKED